MNDQELLQKLMREVFDEESLEINADTSADDVAGWDSFANIQLMAAIEQAFQIKLTTQEAISLKTTRQMLDLIQRKKA